MYDAASPYDTVRAPLTSADDYAPMPAWGASFYEEQARTRHIADPAVRSRAEHAERASAERDAARQAARPEALARIAQQQAERCTAARSLAVRQIGPAQYLVTGGREAHAVDLTADGDAPRCDCADHLYRPALLCKHLVAAMWAAEWAAGERVA